MPSSAPLPKGHPALLAWEAHKKTEEYENSKRWAAMPEHVEGSLWALFWAGWNAARAEALSDASQPTGGRQPSDLSGIHFGSLDRADEEGR